MKQFQPILIFFGALFSAMQVVLASNLPACPSDETAFWHNCYGSYTTADGHQTEAEFQNDELNGQGKTLYANGEEYVGEFSDNQIHGWGTYTYPSGEKYIGEYKNDKRHGHGMFFFPDGSRHVGEFKNELVNGFAVEYDADGTILKQGIWKDDEFQYAKNLPPHPLHSNLPACPSDETAYWHNCFAIFFHDSQSEWAGDKYVGEFRDNKMNGQGAYFFADGSRDVGTFKNSQLHGYAVRYNADGTILKQGIWNDDEFQYNQNSPSPSSPASNLPACPSDTSAFWHNCFGTVTFANGDKYVGEYRDDKRTGQGTYTYPNGDKYVGGFRDNARNGRGTYTFANGEKYVGEYRDNKKHGQGTYTFASGNKYVGEFSDNARNGQGTFTFANGNKYVGGFRDGDFNGQGTFTFASGAKYVGEFRNDKFNGFGVTYDTDGTILRQGIWKDDEFQYAQNSPSTPSYSTPSQDESQIVSASSGSGFAVSNDGYLVTNNHVIEGCQKVFVHRRGKKYETDIVAYDPRNDLALLKGNFQPDVVLPLSSAKPYLAQEIYVSGYPFGMNVSSSVKVTRGIISSLIGIGNNLAEMQIDAALQSGNSGGPILDEYGNVVGVAVAKLDVKFALENFGAIPENTNFGVKANIVEALLDANGVNYQQGKTEKLTGAEFSNMLSNGTYYISCWMTLAQIEAMKTKKVMFGDLQ